MQMCFLLINKSGREGSVRSHTFAQGNCLISTGGNHNEKYEQRSPFPQHRDKSQQTNTLVKHLPPELSKSTKDSLLVSNDNPGRAGPGTQPPHSPERPAEVSPHNSSLNTFSRCLLFQPLNVPGGRQYLLLNHTHGVQICFLMSSSHRAEFHWWKPRGTTLIFPHLPASHPFSLIPLLSLLSRC